MSTYTVVKSRLVFERDLKGKGHPSHYELTLKKAYGTYTLYTHIPMRDYDKAIYGVGCKIDV